VLSRPGYAAVEQDHDQTRQFKTKIKIGHWRALQIYVVVENAET